MLLNLIQSHTLHISTFGVLGFWGNVLNLAITAFLFTESLLLIDEIIEFFLGHSQAIHGYHVLSLQNRFQVMMPIYVWEVVLRGIFKYFPLHCQHDLTSC